MAIANSELKKFLDSKSKDPKLVGELERYLQARPAGDRSTTVIHPSEVIKRDFCRRASYFLLSGRTKIATNPGLRLQSIFDEGHAIHAKWQKWFQDMGVLHGMFKCQVCDKITWGTSPQNCEHCNAPAKKLEYAEVTLFDDALRIKGHTDGWIKGIGDDCLIEIKSIGPGTLRSEAPDLLQQADGNFMEAWKLIKRPFGPHLMQGQMYLELMKRMGHDVKEIVFIYELKADQSYKVFPPIKATSDLVEHIFENCQKVVDAVEAGVAPECNNVPGSTCPQCAPYGE